MSTASKKEPQKFRTMADIVKFYDTTTPTARKWLLRIPDLIWKPGDKIIVPADSQKIFLHLGEA